LKVSQNLSVWAKTIKEAVTSNTAHVARYTFAAQFTSDKLVCDVACGTGYGCFLLSRSATFVVGIDISEEAIL